MKWLFCISFVLPLAFAIPAVEYSLSDTLKHNVQSGEKSLDSLFREFKLAYDKYYADEYEEAMRKSIFEVNLKYIEDHNELYDKGEKSYKLAVNNFADLTHQEFLKFYTSSLNSAKASSVNASTYLPASNVLLPDTVDWRTKGYVTNVKDQGQCGSCWAFSATGSLEGQHYGKSKQLIPLSEQQLVDCSTSNHGCNGGLMDQAFMYIKENGGIEGENDYTYTANEGTCKFDKTRVRATVSGYVDVTSGSETNLQNAVAEVGPVSVAIDASQTSFQFYSTGVYDEPKCSSTKLNHGVLVVGYGTYISDDYWLVKNSWGTYWGSAGYIKMSRNKDNQCGIASYASYPLV